MGRNNDSWTVGYQDLPTFCINKLGFCHTYKDTYATHKDIPNMKGVYNNIFIGICNNNAFNMF